MDDGYSSKSCRVREKTIRNKTKNPVLSSKPTGYDHVIRLVQEDISNGELREMLLANPALVEVAADWVKNK